ncbi:hypothetical protein FPV67DRAFT_1169759 [Lyophyllum atratum]|nr:hypothetical protein FPV67DRAFT_1169759 [Lyophyllum atratum]
MLAIPQKRESDTDASALEDRQSKRVKVELIDEDIKPIVVIKKRSQSPEVNLSHPSPPPLTPPRECVQGLSSSTRTEPSYHIKAEVLLQTAPVLKPEPSIERADMRCPSSHPIPPQSFIKLAAPMILREGAGSTPSSAPPASSPTAHVATVARNTNVRHTISSMQAIPSPALMKPSTRQAARPVAAIMTPPITDSLVPSPRKQMSSSAAQSDSADSSIVRHPAVSSNRDKHVSTSTEVESPAPVAAVITMIASGHIPPTNSPTAVVVSQVAAGARTMSSRQQSPKTAVMSRIASGQLLTAASSAERSSTFSSFAVASAIAPAAAVGSTTSGQPVTVTVPTPPTTRSGIHHPDKTVLAPRGGSKLGIPSSASIPPGATASEIAEAITAANVGRKFHIPEHRELARPVVSRIYDHRVYGQETPRTRELQPTIRHRISSPAPLYYHPSPSPSTTEDEPCLCFICGEDGHKAIECEGTWNSYATWQDGLVIASSGDPICYYFNLHSDICIYGDECRREHVCSLCGGLDHGCCENAC